MSREQSDPLEGVLKRRISLLEAELSARSSGPSSAEVEELERLHRLLALRGGKRPPTWRARAPAVVMVSLALGVLSFLFFERRTETEVEFFVSVLETEFVSARRQTLFSTTPLRSLAVAQSAQLAIPRSKTRAARTMTNSVLKLGVEPVSVGEATGLFGSITLEPIVLEDGTRVRLESTTADSVEVLTTDRPTRVQAVLSGQVLLEGPVEGKAQHDFGRGRKLEVHGETLSLTLDPEPPGLSQVFGQQLNVRELAFSKVYLLEGEHTTVARTQSTIVEGRLFFEELEGRELRLRTGDHLRFEAVDGVLRQLSAAEGRIELAFSGKVRGMSSGSAQRPRSLMPTQFEWIRVQRGWMLLWGSALSVIGLLLSFMRWLGFKT